MGKNENEELSFTDLLLVEAAFKSKVAPYLELIKTFSPEQQVQALLQTNDYGSNVLMIAARYCPSAVAPFLEVIKTFSSEQKAQVFLQCINDGWNALMRAERYSPSAVAPLLEVIITLSLEQQAQVFLQCNDDGWNAIMIAARYCPDAVAPLLEVIKTLPQKEKARVLLQTNKDGWNVLMFVACYCNPKVVASFLEDIKMLSSEHQAQVFLQCNNEGSNILMLVTEFNPSVIKPLLEAILSLPIDVAKKYGMIKKAYEYNSDMELPVMSDAIKMAWQNDIAKNLKRLKTYKNDAHEKPLPIEKIHMKRLYKELKAVFYELLKSNQTHKDFYRYKDEWINGIYNAMNSGVLSKLPRVLDILDESLSIVLGVNIVYLMCEETNQVSKSRDLFFSSVLKGNKLTDVIAETSPVNC
jgi:hypothetical protein